MHAHAARISFRTRCPLRLHSHAVFSRLQCPRTQLILLCFGVWPGLLTVRGRNEWSSVPITVAAPHLGLLEAFWMMAAGMPRPIALEPYTKIPVVGTIFRAAKGIAVPLPKADSVASKPMTPPVAISRTRGARMSREENGLVPAKEEPNPKRSGGSAATTAVRQAIARHKQTWAKGGEAAAGKPIAIMPEGTTHNGHSLIKFFSGAFEGGGPVQPVVLSYPFSRINHAHFSGSLPHHLWMLFSAPWVRMDVRFLPVRHPSQEESANADLYAENVRQEMARAGGLPLSKYSAKDLRNELREKAEAGRRHRE